MRDLLTQAARWRDPDSCKGYPVDNRLISTLLFHLYHERDGDTQEILIALLPKLRLEGAAHVLVVLHHLFTHFETTIIQPAYSTCIRSLSSRRSRLYKLLLVYRYTKHCYCSILIKCKLVCQQYCTADCCYNDFIAKLSYHVH